MKISQFRALIKEEVRKALNESKTTRKTLKEGVIEDLQVEPKTIGVQWEEAENLMDYVKAKHKLGPKKYVAGEGGDVEIYKIGTTPYILVDEDGFGAIFKASDSSKVISAIKDGSYFDWNESVVSQKPLKEAAPKSGQTIDDYDLVETGVIKSAHQDTWLELLSDVPNGWVRNAARKAKVLQIANTWLSKNGYQWSVADALSQDEDGVVTWEIA